MDSVTRYEYDPLKKSFVTKQTVVAANHNTGAFTDLVTVFTPDPFGNVASSTQLLNPAISLTVGLTTSHVYDANNNKTKTTDPRGSLTSFS